MASSTLSTCYLLLFSVSVIYTLGTPKTDFYIKDFNGPMTEEAISAMKDAELLVLTNCSLTAYPERVFSKMPKLKFLKLVNNKFHIWDHNVYKGSRSFVEIYFHDNDIPELELSLLRDTTFKRVVIFNQKQIKKLPQNFANETTRLGLFQCSTCGIGNIEEGAFSNLDKLEHLDLHDNEIKELPKNILTPLKSLKVLNLSGNQIKKFSVDDIRPLHDLVAIDLSNNPLEELNFKDIANVAPNLKHLDLSNTKLTQSAKDDLFFITKAHVIS